MSTAPSQNHYDVIIIGTGAGGGTLAHALAPLGKRVLLLERGGYLKREQENWSSKSVFLDARYKAKEEWLDSAGKVFHPGIHYCVGGNTKVYGAALLRFRESDFGEVVHHGGLSPAWPLGYADFEPYYSEAEQLFQVHGQHGVDPTEPQASRPYPHPPVSHEPRIAELFADLTKAGHHPFPLPVGILLDEQNPQASKCIRCRTCDGFPCVVQAKADSEVICVAPAIAGDNVTLLTHAYVEKLETSATGREVTKVWVRRGENGAQAAAALEAFSADVVVVAAGAINSAALLLRSANEQHPAGLANGSGVVGRHYMAHNNSAMLAISREPNPTIFQKTIGLNDFYHRADDFEFPLGHLQMLGKSDHDMLRGDAPIFAPTLALDYMANHALDFWLTSEDLPDPDNRVTVDAEGRIKLSYKPNNLEGHKRLTAKLKGLLKTLGCDDGHLHARSVYLGKKIPIEGTAHQCGTVRFGHDPKTSALDVNCKAHEVDNLYVVDGSFFVSSTAVNPGLTIMANALRVAEHLRTRLT